DNNGRNVDTQRAFAERYPRSDYLGIIERANPLDAEQTSRGYHLSIPALSSAFVEYVRPATILGRLTGARRVPFNVKVARAPGGTTAAWVGAGDPKPVSEAAVRRHPEWPTPM